jgi:thiol-disulfide isomerase/thioredoxin
MRRLAASLFAFALLAGAVAGCVDKREGAEPAAGKPAAEGMAPGFTLPSISGEKVSLSAYAGRVVVLDFWATWCPPCRQLIPSMVALHERYSPQGLTVIGIALDREGERVVGPIAREAKIPYPILLGVNTNIAEAYGKVDSIPTVFIIDRKGRLVRKLVGLHPFEELESQVKRYL